MNLDDVKSLEELDNLASILSMIRTNGVKELEESLILQKISILNKIIELEAKIFDSVIVQVLKEI